ncbi:MAG: LysR substrate-binding domain-containing protein [Methylophilaceae bacterium]|nr:LysR substrate-binding domain-containing protein [Methylophilaceae bacterium]
MKNLTIRQIKIFICAVKHMNFSKAAEELHVTAPAVSLQIKEMEEDIGVSLFLREGRRVELTSAGEYFLLHARRVISTLKEAADTMDRLKGQDARVLKIGLVSTAKYFVPKILAQFKREYPNAQIRIEVRNRQQLVELLREGDIDIAIMGRPPREIDTRAEAFADHPHVFIASPDHPLAGKENISPKSLNQFELITREQGSGTRYIMETFLAEHDASPVVTMEMSSNESIKQAVMADLGISFVSLHTIGLELENHQIAILDVQNTPIVRTWHVVALSKRNLSQAAEAFRYFMLERGGELLTEMFTPKVLQ